MKEIIKYLIVDIASRALEERFPILHTVGRWCGIIFFTFFTSLFAMDAPCNKELDQEKKDGI